MNNTEIWLYGEGKHTTLEEYQNRSNELHLIGDPIAHRFYIFEQLQFELEEIDTLALKGKQKIEGLPADSHITPEEKKKGLALCEELGGKMQVIHEALQQDRKLTPKLELREIF